nr:MAG TPA: hypothetical protein [Caudoviricetes sp.]
MVRLSPFLHPSFRDSTGSPLSLFFLIKLLIRYFKWLNKQTKMWQ